MYVGQFPRSCSNNRVRPWWDDGSSLSGFGWYNLLSNIDVTDFGTGNFSLSLLNVVNYLINIELEKCKFNIMLSYYQNL